MVHETLEKLHVSLRKRKQTCFQNPTYPMFQFISFKHFFPSYRLSLNSLNATYIPSNISETSNTTK